MSSPRFFGIYSLYISTSHPGITGHTTIRGFFRFMQLQNQALQPVDWVRATSPSSTAGVPPASPSGSCQWEAVTPAPTLCLSCVPQNTNKIRLVFKEGKRRRKCWSNSEVFRTVLLKRKHLQALAEMQIDSVDGGWGWDPASLNVPPQGCPQCWFTLHGQALDNRSTCG